MNEKLLNVGEVAEWLSIKKSTIYDWASKGRIPCLRVGGLLRFDRGDLVGWLASRKEFADA